ncbi:plasmid mobilization protein [Paraburkholderia kururiensis]|uniref:Plasmid mobilization relaxosome protein MobC n=1 Tax=Paraburkholderia kururiensis TaxID=984307 RepID=A0ABZ0WV40_9BURK|nr:plasmid mobilization relaxosome protein MobC [Paraburkholderia kururiensis]WQD81260.1 plasmid mobilization relaxosome protein MobC [Paraburkholderia kururiensis]
MARAPKIEGEKTEKSRPVAFRLKLSDYEAYRAKFTASGLSQSEFFRQYVLTNTTQVIAKPRMTESDMEILRIFRKFSNNVNQIAHRLNADHLEGKVSQDTYIANLEELHEMNRQLKAALRYVIDYAD